jgi:hypothetical protein
MKRTVLALCALLALPSMAQRYTVSGQVPNGVKKVYLQFMGASPHIDSTTVSNGQFRFEGDANGNIFAMATYNKSEGVNVVLEGNVKVDISLKAYGVQVDSFEHFTTIANKSGCGVVQGHPCNSSHIL